MTAEEGGGGEPEPAAHLLDDPDELLYRQVHPAWIVDGEPSSQAFKPTKKDDGMLSIALGSKTSAEDAFLHHTQALELASGGTWAVTVGEAAAVELSSFDQPLQDSPAHGFIDFRKLSRGGHRIQGQVATGESSGTGLPVRAIQLTCGRFRSQAA